ncbi:MAG: outer membrane protein transport protein [Pseudomonadota bacterium]
MAHKTIKTATAILAATLLVGTAHAGGFDRGTADTDILYEDGNFVTRSGITYVSPTLNISTFGGGSTGEVAPDYVVPNFAMKVQATDNVACAGTYTTPFGGSTDYTGTTAGVDSDALATTRQEFVTNELGMTCAYQMDVGNGRVSLLGGVFLQHLDFEQDVVGGTIRLSLNDLGYGYRVGAAYEIPEIALRAQIMYRSAVDVSATGSFDSLVAPVVVNPNAFGLATFPRSVEAKVQSGIAPGWLAFGSVKWTQWSVFDVLEYQAFVQPVNSTLNFFWRDGWTVTGGIARRFNDTFAASASLTWDRGVGTGYDLQGRDVWTVAVGGSATPNERAEIRAGVGLSFFGAASQDFTSDALGNPISSPGFKTSEAGTAIGGSLSAKLKF